MLCLQELWPHFLPEQVPPFQVLAHVKFPHLSLHGAAGSQPWSKFKHCGSEHASSCQKDPNLSVPGPLGKGFLAKVIRDWLHLIQTRQPGWRASPREPGSASHPHRLLLQGLSCMNLIPHWSCPSPAGVEQSSVNSVATHKLVLHLLGCRGPPGQDGLNKDALTTLEPTSNDLCISNYNSSSLLPNSQTSCCTSRCYIYFLTSYKVSYHPHQSPITMVNIIIDSHHFKKAYYVLGFYIQYLI